MRVSPRWRSRIVKGYLHYLASTTKPILLGPWRSELGFEVLYWLPFLTWAQKRYGISPERCCAVSRGGLGALYPAKQHIDLYDLRTVDQVRLENGLDAERRKILKQMDKTPWDDLVLKEAAVRIYGAGEAYHVLHPSWMYWLFDPVWQDKATIQHIAAHTDFQPLPTPTLPAEAGLPPKYVAVRFYERFTFPLQGEVIDFVREMVHAIASRIPVVLLNQKAFVDDHVDLPIVGPNIYMLPEVAPSQNLLVQAAVLAKAEAFIGTYGGVAQWALRYRKPTLSCYTQFNGTAFAHRQLSHLLASMMGIPFELLDLRALRLWQTALLPPSPPPAQAEVKPEPEAVPA